VELLWVLAVYKIPNMRAVPDGVPPLLPRPWRAKVAPKPKAITRVKEAMSDAQTKCSDDPSEAVCLEAWALVDALLKEAFEAPYKVL